MGIEARVTTLEKQMIGGHGRCPVCRDWPEAVLVESGVEPTMCPNCGWKQGAVEIVYVDYRRR